MNSPAYSARPVESILPDQRIPGTLHARSRKPKQAKPEPVGHEAFLKALEKSGAQILVEKLSGEKILGVVKHSDKFTISLTTSEGRTRILFKHDISEFEAQSSRPGKVAEVLGQE